MRPAPPRVSPPRSRAHGDHVARHRLPTPSPFPAARLPGDPYGTLPARALDQRRAYGPLLHRGPLAEGAPHPTTGHPPPRRRPRRRAARPSPAARSPLAAPTPPRAVREVQHLDGLALGRLAAAVVARSGCHAGMAGELLHRREVHPAARRSPTKVRRKSCGLSFGTPPRPGAWRGRCRSRLVIPSPTILPWRVIARKSPPGRPSLSASQSASAATAAPTSGTSRSLSPLPWRTRSVGGSGVQSSRSSPASSERAHPADVEDREDRRVPDPGRGRVGLAGPHQRPQLPFEHCPPCRQPTTPGPLHVADAVVLLGAQQVEVPGVTGDAPQRGQGEVDGRRRRCAPAHQGTASPRRAQPGAGARRRGSRAPPAARPATAGPGRGDRGGARRGPGRR